MNKKDIYIPSEYIVFDLETTGFSCEYNEIIEIGALKISNGKIIDKFQTYVKPKNFIRSNITMLTGISNYTVKNAPPIDEATWMFKEFIKDSILVAHNASFDAKFIGVAFIMCGIEPNNPIYDSLKMARRYISTSNYKLESLKNLLGIDRLSHNAIDDCYVTFKVIEKCRYNKIYEKEAKN